MAVASSSSSNLDMTNKALFSEHFWEEAAKPVAHGARRHNEED
jgi:hypothetical protein